MDGVAEVFVTGPTLMTVTIFSGTFSHRRRAGKALQILYIAVESLAVIANLSQQARSDLSFPRQFRQADRSFLPWFVLALSGGTSFPAADETDGEHSGPP
jgi:hypothetical protein